MDTLSDPETLRGHEDVAFVDAPTEDHQHHFEAYEAAAGTAIVGVTDDDGRLLLLEHDEVDHLALCYTLADPGADFVGTARDAVQTATGVEATIDDALRVRRCTYRSETGEETTGYDVVFAGSPVGDTTIDPDAGHEWTAAWRAPETVELPDEADNQVVDDVRLFV